VYATVAERNGSVSKVAGSVRPARTLVPGPGATVPATRTPESPIGRRPQTAKRPAAQAPKRSVPKRKTPPVRLTRRGRVVVTAAAVLVIGAVSLVAASAAQATSHRGPQAKGNLAKMVVLSGQSLWSIAESAEPNADPRAVIEQIRQLNSLPGYQVTPGETLWVPES
jgi:hypothetical protein